MKLVGSISYLDLLDHNVQEKLTQVQQSSITIEALSKRVVILAAIVKEIGLLEMMKKMDTVTEDLIAIHGKWNDTSVKLVTQNKEFEAIRAQLLRKI